MTCGGGCLVRNWLELCDLVDTGRDLLLLVLAPSGFLSWLQRWPGRIKMLPHPHARNPPKVQLPLLMTLTARISRRRKLGEEKGGRIAVCTLPQVCETAPAVSVRGRVDCWMDGWKQQLQLDVWGDFPRRRARKHDV